MTVVATTAPLFTRLPAGLFASVMGLSGLALAWRVAAETFPVSPWIGDALGGLSLAVFLLLATFYVAKLIQAPNAVRAEFENPVQSSFLATITVTLLLLAGIVRPWSFAMADMIWMVGAAAHLLLAIAIVGSWISRRPDIGQMNPGWFIPTVGHIVASITGAPLGHVELGWFFFAAGAVFTLILYPMVVYRLTVHETLPPALQPTLFILIVPPALIFLASLALGGSVDGVARGFFSIALLVALVLAVRLRQFLALPFAASWWAYTFPLDALTIAALRYHEGIGHPASAVLAALLLALATALVVGVLGLSLRALARGKLLP